MSLETLNSQALLSLLEQVEEISRWNIFWKMFGGLRIGDKPGGSWLSHQTVIF